MGYVFLFLVAVPVGNLVGRMARIYQMKFGSWSGCWVAFPLDFAPCSPPAECLSTATLFVCVKGRSSLLSGGWNLDDVGGLQILRTLVVPANQASDEKKSLNQTIIA